MNKEKIINDLKYLKIAIEWENPLDYQTMITNAITYIENSVEQKHGHWIVRTNFGDGCLEVRCSECGKTGFWRNQPLYCPNCGAKMDEVTEDGKQ